jgi:hypothetical protein
LKSEGNGGSAGTAMTDELVERESARNATAEPVGMAWMLEVVYRLHTAMEEEGLLSAAAAAFAALLGSAPTTVRVRHDAGVPRRMSPEALGDAVIAIMDRAKSQGLPVIDDHPPGGVALPVSSSDRTIGAVYVAHPGAGRAKGPGLDLLKIVAAHVAAASSTFELRRSAMASPATGESVPRDLSLREAKLEFERRLLQVRLDAARGNVAAAARSLDMDRGQLSRLMKKHALDRAAFRPARTP